MVYENGPATMAMARSSASVLRGLLSQRHWSLTVVARSTVGMETRASSSGTEGGGGEEGPAPGAREKEVGVTVSSLRVDAVASMGLGISRKYTRCPLPLCNHTAHITGKYNWVNWPCFTQEHLGVLSGWSCYCEWPSTAQEE